MRGLIKVESLRKGTHFIKLLSQRRNVIDHLVLDCPVCNVTSILCCDQSTDSNINSINPNLHGGGVISDHLVLDCTGCNLTSISCCD